MQPYLDIGMILYAAAVLVWFKIISTQPLSIAYPIFVSLVFFLVTLGAIILFKESLSLVKIIGLAIVLVGIMATNRGE
jgi:multidrug transporter EmrE-like cation transporter